MYEITRPEDAIDDLLNNVMDKIDEGGSKFPGLTFEEGVRDSILWLTGQSQDHPYED